MSRVKRGRKLKYTPRLENRSSICDQLVEAALDTKTDRRHACPLARVSTLAKRTSVVKCMHESSKRLVQTWCDTVEKHVKRRSQENIGMYLNTISRLIEALSRLQVPVDTRAMDFAEYDWDQYWHDELDSAADVKAKEENARSVEFHPDERSFSQMSESLLSATMIQLENKQQLASTQKGSIDVIELKTGEKKKEGEDEEKGEEEERRRVVETERKRALQMWKDQDSKQLHDSAGLVKDDNYIKCRNCKSTCSFTMIQRRSFDEGPTARYYCTNDKCPEYMPV